MRTRSRMQAGLFLLVWISTACGTGQSKDGKKDFPSLIARGEELRAKGSTESALYAALLSDFQELFKRESDITSNAANKKLAEDFLAQHPPLSCNLTVSEPSETLRTVGGFTTPLLISGDCPAKAPFVLEADSKDLALAPENVVFSGGKITAEIRVNSATTEPAKNRIRITSQYYAAELLAELARRFALPQKSELTINPAEYTLRTQPTTRDAYADAHLKFRKAALSSSAKNGDFGSEVALSANGQFTVGGEYAGKKFDLLYGHPNGTLPDGIGTTFTTVRVDGTDYRFEKLRGKPFKNEAGQLLYEAAIGRTGITIRQIISPESADNRIKTRIAYEIRNRSGKRRSVGIRLLLDTWAGANDGVPFLLPTGDMTQLYRSEVEFTPTASPMWQIFDVDRAKGSASKEPALQNILIGKDIVPPDRVAFANWPEAIKSVWDYAINSARRVTGDSAVILWWNPAEVAAGKTQIIATEFGAYLQKREPAVFITNADTGEILIYLWHQNGSDATQKLAYTVRAEKGDLLFKVDLSETTLAPGQTFIKASPGQILFEGGTTLIITETLNGQPKEYKFPLANLKKWKKLMRTPLAEPAKAYPVSYFDERDMQLRARLRSAGGETLQTIPLEKTAIDGGFEYKGNFEIPADAPAGRYTVEVVR